MKVSVDLYYGYTDKENNRFGKAVVSHIDGDTEALFLSPLSYKKNNLLEQVLERCLVEVQDEFGNASKDSKTHILNSLAPGDINLLILGISTATHETTEREINTLCPQCKKPNLIKFDVEKDLKYNKPIGVPSKRFSVEVGKRVFTLEWQPQSKVKEISTKLVGEEVDGQVIYNVMTLRNEIMKLAIKQIVNGDKQETFADVPGKVLSQLIKKYSEDYSYGVSFEKDCVCFDCKHQWEQNIVEPVTEDKQPGGLWSFFGINTPGQE